MPKGYGYKTGGKHPGSGYPGKYGEHGPTMGVDVTTGGAGMGTTSSQPNVKDKAGPGGYGSAGTASNSSPKGMK